MNTSTEINICEFIPSGEDYIRLVESTGWNGIVDLRSDHKMRLE
ncbi:hypothetical protein YSY43_07680 [Paenibacillus sp. YSY-4.3]